MRSRSEFRALAEKKVGAKLGDFNGFPNIKADRPNIVVLGLGHANTSITAKQLFALGWQAGDADDEWGESVSVRDINDEITSASEMVKVLAKIPTPWAIKDPRFSRGKLHQWIKAFSQYEPLLLWIVKDLDEVLQSYVRRDQRATMADLTRWTEYCQQQFDQWPWKKLRIRAEDIGVVCEMWKRK
jgi:hypothetical protein